MCNKKDQGEKPQKRNLFSFTNKKQNVRPLPRIKPRNTLISRALCAVSLLKGAQYQGFYTFYSVNGRCVNEAVIYQRGSVKRGCEGWTHFVICVLS